MSEVSNYNVEELVRRDQADHQLHVLLVSLPANMLIALSSLVLFFNELPRNIILIWFASVVGSNAIRFIAATGQIKLKMEERNVDETYYNSVIGGCINGVIWSLLLPLDFYYTRAQNPTLIYVLGALTAGSIVQGTAYRHQVWAFCLPILLTLIATEFMIGTAQGYIIAADVFVFAFMLLRGASTSEAFLTNAKRLAHEANQLKLSVTEANDVASAAAKRMEYLANHDSLTGLGNRTAFSSAISDALVRASNIGGEVTLLLIDLDRFKAVNDTFGHVVGDGVLVEVARSLRGQVSRGTFAARLGGDEFAIIIEGDMPLDVIKSVGERLIASLCKPITVDDRLLTIGACIGFSIFPNDAEDVKELQICADVALYAAKSAGRDSVRGFDDKLREERAARRVIEMDLREAIDRGDLEVWFQPQISLRDHRLMGLEALIRWNHPVFGWVAPPDIVSAAAASNVSEALTGFVIAACCRMIEALNARGYDTTVVSFNVSPQELGRYPIAKLIQGHIERWNVPANRLELEITEEAMLSEERGGTALRAIEEIGVKIAIDDFGVGYSSFGALRTLKFDCIKIDRVFVSGLTAGSDDRALVRAILSIARALGVKAIAEGVETAEQASVLLSLGCECAQGYYFARPMALNDVFNWLAAKTDQVSDAEEVGKPGEPDQPDQRRHAIR